MLLGWSKLFNNLSSSMGSVHLLVQARPSHAGPSLQSRLAGASVDPEVQAQRKDATRGLTTRSTDATRDDEFPLETRCPD